MPATAKELIETLESEVCSGLGTFMNTQGATYDSGFASFDAEPSRLKKKKIDGLGLFWYVCRYTFPSMYLDIGFGDKEYLVEPKVNYPSLGLSHHPTILAEAAKINVGGLGGNSFVLEAEFMRSTVSTLCEGIKANWSMLFNPKPEVLDRAQQILGRRLIFAKEEQRRKDREGASIKASESFHKGDFKMTVELLQPFAKDNEFSKSASVMLKMAKQRR